jgi:DNA-binding NarL/FixJ family response regulator
MSRARGFLVKDAPMRDLADAMRRLVAGERVVDLESGTVGAGRWTEPAECARA